MGWYDTIYVTISDILFAGSAPAGSLEFIVQQVSCYLTLFFTLLPVIFAIAFFVKALRL